MAMTLESMVKLYTDNKDTVKKAMDITDAYINAQTKLKLINDGLQTQADLQNKVYAAANRSRDTYMDMVSTVSKLGMTAGDAFSSNDQMIKFAELAQKSLKLGGATPEKQSSDMDMLTEAMAGGKLTGGDFTTLMEDAPMLEQALAEFTGKSIADLEKMGEQGNVTAEMIKGALFTASDEIDSKFAALPMTFADVWTEIKNAGIQAFSGVMESISNVINTAGFQGLINAILIGIFALGGVLDWIINMTTQYWGFLAPILETVAGVLLVSITQGLWASAAAAWAAITPWLVANWYIIAIVAAVVAVISIFSSLGISVRDVVSFIGGVIGVFVAFFYNKFVYLWNIVASFVNFLGFVFNNPITIIKALFLEMAINVLENITKIGKGIENILGKIGIDVDITSKLDNIKNSLEKASETVKNEAEYTEYMKGKNVVELSTAYNIGSEFVTEGYDFVVNKVSNITDNVTLITDSVPGYDDLGTSSNPATVQGTGSDGGLSVDMGEEDLQYLRDMAERDYINKFSSRTLAPNIQVTFGDVHQTADVDQVAGRMQKILQEQIATTGEGVY